MKLKHKSRNGARVHKVYDTAQTRIIACWSTTF